MPNNIRDRAPMDDDFFDRGYRAIKQFAKTKSKKKDSPNLTREEAIGVLEITPGLYFDVRDAFVGRIETTWDKVLDSMVGWGWFIKECHEEQEYYIPAV